MLAEERRQEILNILSKQKSVHVAELSKQFDVTEETIRRDLEKLNRKKLLKRTHGGAVPLQTNQELSFKTRKEKNKLQKQQIARKAIKLINDGDTIFLDASSTSMYLAQKLTSLNDITVITNSALIVFEIAKNDNINIISTGGLLRSNSLSFVGPLTNESIQKYYADKFFASCKGISLEHGATDSNELELEVKRKMVKNSKETIILANKSKFNEIGLSQFASLNEINQIITDDTVNENILEQFRKKGKNII